MPVINYKLVGKLNLITDNLGTPFNTKVSEMEQAAFGNDVSSYKKVTENVQYVDGLYNTTIAYYEQLQPVTT